MMRRLVFFLVLLCVLSGTSLAGLQTASQQLAEELMAQLIPIETNISYREGSLITLPIGRNDGVREGQVFEIYSQETFRYLGLIEVTVVRTRNAEAVILEEREEIKQGDTADEIVGGRVAILGFLDPQERETLFSRSFQGLLTNAFTGYPGFEVVERSQLEQHLEELKLSYSGLLERDAPEAGQILGTDLIIVGGVMELHDEIIVNARINETETGRLLASGSVRLSKTPSIEALLVSPIAEVPSVERLEVRPESITMFSGESVELYVVAFDGFGFVMHSMKPQWSTTGDFVQLSSVEGERVILEGKYGGQGQVRVMVEGVSKVVEVEVREIPKVSRLLLTPKEVELSLEESREFHIEGRDQYGDKIEIDPKWSILSGVGELSSRTGTSIEVMVMDLEPIVLEVEADGLIERARIQVKAPQPVIEDEPVAANLEIIPHGPTKIFLDEPLLLEAIVSDTTGRPISTQVYWALSDDAVDRASLSSKESEEVIVTGFLPGTIRVEASVGTLHDLIEIEVREAPRLKELIISPDSSWILLGEEQKLYVQGLDQYGDPIEVDVDWSIITGSGRLSPEKGDTTMVTAYAEGEVMVQAKDRDISVTSKIVVQSPVVALVPQLLDEYVESRGSFTIGLDVVLLGYFNKNKALGYPNWCLGGNLGIGMSWRNYSNLPSLERVEEAAVTVLERNPDLTYDLLRRDVKEEIGKRWFTYFGINTFFLIAPNVEVGTTYDFTGPDGEGITFNLGAVWGLGTYLIPLPYLGLQYTF